MPPARAVLDKLLAGDHPVLKALRGQADGARLSSRELTGAGFFCVFEVFGPPLPTSHRNFEIGDVNARIEGLSHGAGFVLFVRDGRLNMLEGYSYEEPWPEQVCNFDLTYQNDRRSLKFPEN
jgi:hypothetical protein